jgi:drug/metabolite transporter (DMT)-like permease
MKYALFISLDWHFIKNRELKKMDREKRIFTLLAFVILVWGLNVVMIKYLVQSNNPLQLAAFRITAASLLLVPLVIWQTGWKSFKLDKRAILPTMALGVCAIYLHQLFLSYGLTQAHAAVSGLILGLNPLTTALLAAIFLKEAFTLTRGLGVLIGFIGVLLVVLNSSQNEFGFSKGEWLVVGAMLTYVIGNLFVKLASRFSTVLVMTAYSHSFASILLLITWSIQKPAEHSWWLPPVSWSFMGIFLLSACAATALCALWWNKGIQLIGPARTSMFLNGLPLASILSAAFFLGEQIKWIYLFALICIIIGVYLGTKGTKMNRAPLMNHESPKQTISG